MAPALPARRVWRELQAAKAGMPEEERDKVTGRFYRVDARRQQTWLKPRTGNRRLSQNRAYPER